MIKHFTTVGIVLNEKNEVLLVKHKKLGVWIYPGGHIEENETPDECVIREILEETKLEAEIVDTRNQALAAPEIGVSVLHNPEAILLEKIEKGDEIHYHIDLVYRCKIKNSSELDFDERESEGIGFFSKEQVEKLEMFHNCRQAILTVLNKIQDEN